MALGAIASAFVATHADELIEWPVALAAAVHHGNPATVALLPAVVGAEDRTGRHLGFDTYAYPGDDVMRAWREKGPYEWVGYYLPAPCHDDNTWAGTRDKVASMGWGMAVIYVGQQTWDKTPRGYETHYRTVHKTHYVSKRVKTYRRVNGKRVARYMTRRVPVKRAERLPVRVTVDPRTRPIDDCNAQLVNATRGRMEAQDAIARTAREGFPAGTVIFLDVEYMKATPPKMRDYYRAWTRTVLEDGRFRPGVYAHTRNAELIYRDVKAEFANAGVTYEPPFWIAGQSKSFHPDRKPTDVGHAFAAMWQGMLDTVEEVSGFALPIDVNVSEVPDPSRRYVTTE